MEHSPLDVLRTANISVVRVHDTTIVSKQIFTRASNIIFPIDIGKCVPTNISSGTMSFSIIERDAEHGVSTWALPGYLVVARPWKNDSIANEQQSATHGRASYAITSRQCRWAQVVVGRVTAARGKRARTPRAIIFYVKNVRRPITFNNSYRVGSRYGSGGSTMSTTINIYRLSERMAGPSALLHDLPIVCGKRWLQWSATLRISTRRVRLSCTGNVQYRIYDMYMYYHWPYNRIESIPW